jgi:hypothetical protein
MQFDEIIPASGFSVRCASARFRPNFRKNPSSFAKSLSGVAVAHFSALFTFA